MLQISDKEAFGYRGTDTAIAALMLGLSKARQARLINEGMARDLSSQLDQCTKVINKSFVDETHILVALEKLGYSPEPEQQTQAA